MAGVPGDLKTTNDRMRSVDEAVEQLAASLSAIADVETVPLALADGRVMVEDLVAPIELPPFTNSAVDGYAVRFADVAAGGGRHLSPLA